VRQKLISRYCHSIDSAIHHIQERNTRETNHSQVFYALSIALGELSKSHTDRKFLIVLSDLAENTDGFSVYKPGMLDLLKANSDSMATILHLNRLPKSLKGITVYFVHAPQNLVDDERFGVISTFLRLILEEREAKVIITSNL